MLYSRSIRYSSNKLFYHGLRCFSEHSPAPSNQDQSNASCQKAKNSDEENKTLKRFVYERFADDVNPVTGEVEGPRGPEPTRYGDWERKGRCIDF
ncbi:unnamed protein product [Protopolystoma xenopodis]|uniref:Succinate dehydrogenase assembly factor 4, mitochondrial n=1 Tax=Protopolystoma xenopodis TaxID=117903 RepID=A0A448X1K7_9PLAT|nr:unnamed protein product [Protopolystoma xenopodis]